MFPKIALAVAVIVGTASASLAAPKHASVAAAKHSTYSEPEYFKQATGAEWWKI